MVLWKLGEFSLSASIFNPVISFYIKQQIHSDFESSSMMLDLKARIKRKVTYNVN